jgi:hypothetical protein
MIDDNSIKQSLTLHKETVTSALTSADIDTESWPTGARFLIAYQQLMMQRAGIDVGAIDGYVGPQTLVALERWQDRLRDIPAPLPTSKDAPSNRWPTQAQAPSFYGTVGGGQTLYKPPYQFYLYDTKQKVNQISVHGKVAASLARVLNTVLAKYGATAIHDLHLDRYFGSLAVRRMRGGAGWSMHSWGVAIDFDATRNQLRWGSGQAAFSKAVYDKWWKAWETEGWVSLGRERNYDWMHVQAARL